LNFSEPKGGIGASARFCVGRAETQQSFFL
jgi:hypothetical protein